MTQEAFAIAAARCLATGCPKHPGAWLMTTARNRAINRIRSGHTGTLFEPVRTT